MNKKLFIEALVKIIMGIVTVGMLIFLPAGTLDFPGGWILMTVLFVPMFFAGIVMMIKNPTLLKRRINGKEKQNEQKTVIALSGLMFVCGFVVAGIDFRFGWSTFPDWLSTVGVVIFIVAYILYAEVIRENEYLSRVVEVCKNQKVIDTGMYGIIRHPMYFATVILFLAMPVILGSVYSFIIFLTYPFIIARRISFEETFLENHLDGYKEYKQKVKYRLLPYIW